MSVGNILLSKLERETVLMERGRDKLLPHKILEKRFR
jgi:hypothetical protein